MESFENGDVVGLKSSGIAMTLMTVEAIEDDLIYCVWFDQKDQLHRDVFYADTLVKIR